MEYKNTVSAEETKRHAAGLLTFSHLNSMPNLQLPSGLETGDSSTSSGLVARW